MLCVAFYPNDWSFRHTVTGQLILELAPPPSPTFDNYLPGRNRAAVAALRAAVAGEQPGGAIYLWGEPGTGRSHLLEATVRGALAAKRTALFAPADRPLPESSADIVAIDDIDALDAAGQILAFDAFNAARAHGATFLAAGREPPQRLALREDLRTRLASGLVFELVALGETDKHAALRSNAAARGMALPDEVAAYLLRHLRRDLGTQFAVLDALDRYSLAHKRAVTLPLVREALDALALR
jgi:DnaA family protein